MGATQCIKYLTFAFNLLFFMMGCGIMGLGIWLKVEKGDYVEISQYNFVTAANLSIAAGAIILVVAFFGCCGAIKENSCLLLTFFVMMLIIFMVEVGAAGFSYAKRKDLQDELSIEFKKTIKDKYGVQGEDGVVEAIDKFQKNFHCCGYDSYIDWRGSYYNNQTKSIPKSCCMDENNSECGKPNPSSLSIYYTKGCFNEVKEFLKDNLLYIGACAIAFAVIQILGMVFAMILYCKFRGGNAGTFA